MPLPADLLRAGKCTGALTFPGADGVRKLQVRWSTRGRGLFAADNFKRGDIVTTVAGEVVDSCESKSHKHEVWHISKCQYFVMNYAFLGADSGLGILANTAGGSGMHLASYQLLARRLLLLLLLLLLVVVVLFFLRLISFLICFFSHRFEQRQV
jgi:hypothetical protein